jgi:hypothetical protein
VFDAAGDECGGADVGAVEEGTVNVTENGLAEGLGGRERGAAGDNGEGAGACGDEGFGCDSVGFNLFHIDGAEIDGG